MFKKIFIYLLRIGVGFYFAYPAIQEFLKGVPKDIGKTIYSCFNNFYPQISIHNMWLIWTLFFIVLGVMIALWKTPLSWIIFGIIILIFKIWTTTQNQITLTFLIQIIPVLLVSIALAIYYSKNEFGHH
jgi:ABC-type proline/glycine betaine transport system permease subunit